MILLGLIHGNLMEFQKKKIENMNKSGSNFTATFIDHYVLSYINFNGHCLINNKISISKKVINLYFLHTKSMVKKFKRVFYVKELLICICKAN